MDNQQSNSCKANGCPLPYTVVTDRHASQSKKQLGLPKWGVCQYHHEAPGDEWGQVTQRIKRNLGVLQLFAKITSLSDAQKPIQGETISLWMQRVNQALEKDILNKAQNTDCTNHFAQIRAAMRVA